MCDIINWLQLIFQVQEQDTEAAPANSKDIQQFYYECLGDRDWEEYKYNEYIFLKRNIGFAIYGAPNEENALQSENVNESVTGYSKKQDNHINEILDVIFKNSKFLLYLTFALHDL